MHETLILIQNTFKASDAPIILQLNIGDQFNHPHFVVLVLVTISQFQFTDPFIYSLKMPIFTKM